MNFNVSLVIFEMLHLTLSCGVCLPHKPSLQKERPPEQAVQGGPTSKGRLGKFPLEK